MTKTSTCLLCGHPVTSETYEVLGKTLWSRVHQECVDRYKAERAALQAERAAVWLRRKRRADPARVDKRARERPASTVWYPF